MRLAGIVVAVTLAGSAGSAGSAGCGGAKPPAVDVPESRGDSPFGAIKDFQPKAFQVEVTGTGRPIVFIPGLGCPGEVWNETVAHLGEEDYQTHVLTLAGFAGTKPIKEPLSSAVRRDLTR